MSMRSRLQAWHPEAEFRNLLAQVKKLTDSPNLERNILMAISKEVQDLADKTRELTGVVQSVDQGFKALTSQVTDLTLQIASIPTAPAPAMSEEDKAALVQTAQDTQGLIDTLKTDIPANVVAPAPAPADVPPAPPAPPAQ